ncbi:MAG: DNA/RNA helicase domain-containing protein [Gemmatimonadaceae bacterium]
MSERPPAGWYSSLTDFVGTPSRSIRERLSAFIPDASREQVRAWDDSIPQIQAEVVQTAIRADLARRYSAILEYELPMESRRPDVVLLVGANVMVIELKGKRYPSQADLDQAAAYARDLRNYHRECQGHDVTPVLVPTLASGYLQEVEGVHVTGPDALDGLVTELTRRNAEPIVDRDAFLAESAYCPLPTIVEAARELLASGSLRRIHKAHAATGPTLDEITRVVHVAAATKSRHLILVTGVPGAGKTLVGLQTVHAKYLDDLAVERADGKPTAPAVFLSGNGPLVEVLQYEMRSVGDGKAFVRGVKDYVKRYARRPELVPPEHVLVFDEAQRAFDADKVRETQKSESARSEPEEFISFADRIPEWCVVVGLIGTGQEIHVGEEAGLGQWRTAVENSSASTDWTVHAPPGVAGVFRGATVPFEAKPTLALDTELRFHQAKDLHRFVDQLLSGVPAQDLASMGARLNADGMHLRITRSLDTAKQYLRDRYSDDPLARFGLIASSKDKELVKWDVANDFQSTKRVHFGPWYGDDEHTYGGQSCRLLQTCVTEFGAQGLELDAALLAWGTDLVLTKGNWSNAKARGYLKSAHVKDPFQLRVNAYRVLLTRGRDGTVIFVPPIAELDETHSYLVAAGVVSLA